MTSWTSDPEIRIGIQFQSSRFSESGVLCQKPRTEPRHHGSVVRAVGEWGQYGSGAFSFAGGQRLLSKPLVGGDAPRQDQHP